MIRHMPRFLVALALLVCAIAHPLGADQSTPSAAMRAYYDAARRKNVNALKKLMPSAALKEMQAAGVPAESVLLAASRDVPATMPEIRNERVDGSQATLEVYNAKTGHWETVAFMKEEGVWKLDLASSEKRRER